MTLKTVSYKPGEVPHISLEELERLKKLENQSDDEIDTSDIPELTDAQLLQIKEGILFRPVKKQVTVRLDVDVLAWLKAGGKGYQTRMNKILRRAMQTYTWDEIKELHSLEVDLE